MGNEQTSFEQRIVARYVNDSVQGIAAIGIFIWLFASLKLYYFDDLPGPIWEHTGHDDIQKFIAWIAASITILSAIGYVAAGILFCLMTFFVIAFLMGSINGFYDRLFPNKESLTERQSFFARWFVLLPVSIPIWFVFATGLYQLAKFELWVFYR